MNCLKWPQDYGIFPFNVFIWQKGIGGEKSSDESVAVVKGSGDEKGSVAKGSGGEKVGGEWVSGE